MDAGEGKAKENPEVLAQVTKPSRVSFTVRIKKAWR